MWEINHRRYYLWLAVKLWALFATSPQMMTVNKLSMPLRGTRSYSIIQQVLSDSHRSHQTVAGCRWAQDWQVGFLWERLLSARYIIKSHIHFQLALMSVHHRPATRGGLNAGAKCGWIHLTFNNFYLYLEKGYLRRFYLISFSAVTANLKSLWTDPGWSCTENKQWFDTQNAL